MVPLWGRCTTHFRTYFSGDWDVYWGYGVLTHSHMCMSRFACLGVSRWQKRGDVPLLWQGVTNCPIVPRFVPRFVPRLGQARFVPHCTTPLCDHRRMQLEALQHVVYFRHCLTTEQTSMRELQFYVPRFVIIPADVPLHAPLHVPRCQQTTEAVELFRTYHHIQSRGGAGLPDPFLFWTVERKSEREGERLCFAGGFLLDSLHIRNRVVSLFSVRTCGFETLFC